MKRCADSRNCETLPGNASTSAVHDALDRVDDDQAGGHLARGADDGVDVGFAQEQQVGRVEAACAWRAAPTWARDSSPET